VSCVCTGAAQLSISARHGAGVSQLAATFHSSGGMSVCVLAGRMFCRHKHPDEVSHTLHLAQSHSKLCTTFALKFLPGQTLRPGRVKADLAECQDS